MQRSIETALNTPTLVDRESLAKIERLRAVNAELLSAAKELNALVTTAQEMLCAFLTPDSTKDERECMNALLELFDGPRQREVQSKYRAAIAKAAP